jgi:hypothetical protein
MAESTVVENALPAKSWSNDCGVSEIRGRKRTSAAGHPKSSRASVPQISLWMPESVWLAHNLLSPATEIQTFPFGMMVGATRLPRPFKWPTALKVIELLTSQTALLAKVSGSPSGVVERLSIDLGR